jgi:hypothetical protein
MAKRGSDELLKAWKHGGAIDEDFVEELVRATANLELVDVLVKGQPKPDFLRASAASEDPEQCGNTVINLLGLLKKGGIGGSPVITVVPRGIPNVERFIVQVSIGEGL